MPHDGAVERGRVRSQPDPLRADRGAHADCMHPVPFVGRILLGTSTQCSACHLADYQKTTNPNHAAAGFPQDCTACHTTAQWKGASFDHNRTRFALTGAHVQTACTQCHVGRHVHGTCQRSALAATCRITRRRPIPNHVAAGFPQDCTACHTTTQWKGATFDHNRTRFALTGAHVQTACTQCHSSGVYTGLATTCVTCHLPNYQKTTNPNHTAAGFPQDCTVCHNTTAWARSTFDHNAATQFPLTGAHVQATCTQCHAGGKYAGTSTPVPGLPSRGLSEDHQSEPRLGGIPADMLCLPRHHGVVTGVVQPQHGDAVSAHRSACASRLRPVPLGGRICGSGDNLCLVPPGELSEDHQSEPRRGRFPAGLLRLPLHDRLGRRRVRSLEGALPAGRRHTSVPSAPVATRAASTRGSPPPASSCHLAELTRGRRTPNHATAGFPQQCELCHTPAGWVPASFNHASTRFPLTGAHTSVACASCHIGGKYAGTPTDCYSCHKAIVCTRPRIRITRRRASQPPARPATPRPPGRGRRSITPGSRYRTKTARLCSDCHTNPSDYKVFALHWLPHQDPDGFSPLGQKRNYVWNSANCYQCHPQGRID